MQKINQQMQNIDLNDAQQQRRISVVQEPVYVQKQCPHCQQQQNVNIKQKKVEHSFYMEEKCTKCHQQFYYFNCPCKHIYTSKEPFLQGTIYKCPNNQCEVKQIQLFRCGKLQCKAINMYPGNYKMGEFLSCCKCQTSFQQVCCPICMKNMYFLQNAPYKPAQLIQCYNCQNKFEHYNCLTCCNPLYSKHEQFKVLTRDMCDNCNKGCFKIACPKCNLPNFRLNFHPYQIDQCSYCKFYYQFFDCPSCKKSNKISTQYNGMDYGHKQCQHCQYKFNILQCIKCKSQLLQENIKNADIVNNNDKLKITCKYCQQKQIGVTCHQCNSSFGLENQEVNSFNCHKCDALTVLRKDNQQQVQLSQINLEKNISNKKDESEDDDKFLCKICFAVNANHIFTGCGHLVSCDTCTPDLKEKCPLCRVQSKSQKIFI